MINKKSLTAAFPLIELLVVITIIGILAGIALPVFNSVQVKGAQTKCLAQAKQIGLALKLFASDNDGNYPQKGIPASANNFDPTTSNQAFATLFPTYVQNEAIFWNKLAKGYCKITAPDNQLDASGDYSNGKTLVAGENAYGYMSGLNDSSNPSYPLVFDATTAQQQSTYAAPNTAGPGSTWNGTKTIVVCLDNSARIDNLSAANNYKDYGATGLSQTADLLTPVTGAWLDGAKLLDPIGYNAN